MRNPILIAAVCAVAACSNTNSGPSVMNTVLEQVKSQRAGPTAPKRKQSPPRSEIDRVGLAMVQMNLEGESIWPVMFAATINGPLVTYTTKLRQALTLHESQIVATRGLGTDLIGAASSDNDPLKKLTPPDAWPETVKREYRVAGDGPTGAILSFNCKMTRGGDNTITLAGTKFAVVGFVESCAGPSGQFQNLYAADARTGRVWQSRQFIGHGIAPVVLDVLEPYGP